MNIIDQGSKRQECPLGIRRSEPQKKPSSRWNEEAEFQAPSPRSANKKGTSSTPSPAHEVTKLKLEDSIDNQAQFEVLWAVCRGSI